MSDDNPQPRILTEQQQGVKTVCEVCGWQVSMMAGRAARLYKQVQQAGGSWMDIEAHYSQTDHGAAWWWYRDDWRGKRGERPADHSIRETWGRWTLPVAVQMPQTGAGALLAYARELRINGDTAGSD